ncbi:hypothetical protein N7462_001987 [Penicillium macrosclerotiorum]|uniref:uncharacterized protein n=1 Tax=Penicillium macrosclerotiorum TaxID=303699 RepID=UPI00254972AB|nr:uncharacterized protein N7462_001987 [Penicillium macrosclerotiorum]KAJ5692564.1 hypothetical protein N7462_001987 [Penicillium macrosclerotiorum]
MEENGDPQSKLFIPEITNSKTSALPTQRTENTAIMFTNIKIVQDSVDQRDCSGQPYAGACMY